MFKWSENKLELYIRAAKYTRFNERLGKIIKENIGDNKEIWDIGSGVSFLSLYLSEYSKSVYCVDICEDALSKLDKLILDKNILNIKTINKSYEEFFDENESTEVIILSHFLNIIDNLELLLSKAEKIVIIKNKNERKDKSLCKYSKQNIEDVERFLMKEYDDLNYKKILYKDDFGQPLKSIEEAHEYYKAYSGDDISREKLLNILMKTDNSDYPYYYPKEKITGIIIIDNKL